MAKYLIITKERDFVDTKWKQLAKTLDTIGVRCQVYDKNGTLVYPAQYYDGEDREWAKWFIQNHKVGEGVANAQEYYYKEVWNK